MIIEKGVPLTGETRGGVKKYPFGEMEVGDSIYFENEPKGAQSNPAVAARMHGRYHGVRFVCRKEFDGVRIWRVE